METESNIKFNTVMLDSEFLEKYLNMANQNFVLIYIYVKSVKGLSVSQIAKGLSMSVMSVYEAVAFWQEEGILQEKDGIICLAEAKKKTTSIKFDERPEYEPMELAMYAEKNTEIKELFSMTQKYMGRLLTHNDLAGIFGIYNWVGLSIPVIEKLLQYCVENNHRNMRYIERVAIDWAENEIATPQEAEEKIKMYNSDFRRIMRAMGQNNRNPVDKEEKYMTAWIKEFKLPIEVIEMACEKTVLNTGKASFGYANKILSAWKEEDVRSCEEANALEAKFNAEKQKNAKDGKDASGRTQHNAPRKNRFVNFEQRDYDYEAYERKEFERISKKEQ